MRRSAAALVALLLLGVAASSLAPVRRPRPQHKPAGATSQRAIARPGAAAPVSAGELRRAREAAARFLEGYLPFVYGRAPARSVAAVRPPLRRELTPERAILTPAEGRRHPRVVWIEVAGRASGVALANVLVEDGGITSYALRLTLRRGQGGWLVSAVDGG